MNQYNNHLNSMRSLWSLGGRLWQLAIALLLGCLWLSAAQAREYVWTNPEQQVLLGKLSFYVANGHETYAQIAAIEDVAYDNLNAANPGVGPENLGLDQIYAPHAGTALVIPTEVLLPPVAHRGIVINVAEKRLYFFQPKQHRVFVYPIGIGRQAWETPLGFLHIDEKIKNPVWIVPDSIMQYRQLHGDPINKIVQSGPDNPLGYFAMRLSNHSYLIHGTNEPAGVGRRSSAGCIRLYADDIKQLFSMAQVGTPVHIINMPFKVVTDTRKNSIIVALHPPFAEDEVSLKHPLQVLKKAFATQKRAAVFVASQKNMVWHLKQKTGLPFVPNAEIAAMIRSVLG